MTRYWVTAPSKHTSGAAPPWYAAPVDLPGTMAVTGSGRVSRGGYRGCSAEAGQPTAR